MANESGFWETKSRFCALGVDFGPLSVNWEHVGVEFLELWKLILGFSESIWASRSFFGLWKENLDSGSQILVLRESNLVV